MSGREQRRVSAGSRRERPRGSWSRRIVLLLVIVVLSALGVALGAALKQGSGPKGMQTRERTIQIDTAAVTRP